MPSPRITREPFLLISREQAKVRETYGGTEGVVVIYCQLLRAERRSDTCLVTMHPVGGTGWLPVMSEFVAGGVDVLACDGRYRGADYALNMEKCALDLGAAVRHAREKLGYRHVVLLGWSGGGSLSAYYQSQAEHPTVTESPGGGGADLTAADLLPADGVIQMAAHVSRHETLTQWLDASILDERDPDRRDPSLDLYGDEVRPPYSDAFLERYRAAQIARNRRITSWVKAKLRTLADTGREDEEFAFVTHGTMADPRWLDPAIDPNGRAPGHCYLGDPRGVNNAPAGLARYSSLRSWLSQWSYDDALADGPASLARVTCPVLVIGNTADDACTPGHTHALHDAAPADGRTLRWIEGANHYYAGQPEKAREAVLVVLGWLNGILR